MARRYFSNTFTATELTTGVNTTDTSLVVAAVSGAPASTPWTGVLDRGSASEELVEVTNVSGTTLTVTRALDGTTAKTHSVGASFEHVLSARDLDEANAVAAGGGTITAPSAGVIPLVVKGAASQTAALIEAQNSAGTVLLAVEADGRPRFSPANSVNVTIGSNGGSNGGTNSIIISNGTAPTSNVGSAGSLYCAGGALYFRGELGTITKLANA